MTKASNNEFPSVLFDEQAGDPSTPASGFWRAYIKSDGMYIIDDAGGVTGPFAETSGTGVQRGSAFPGSPATGDLFQRSDLQEIIFVYDGTRWVSQQMFTAVDYQQNISADLTVFMPLSKDFQCFLETWDVLSYISNTATWVVTLQTFDTENDGLVTLDSVSTAAQNIAEFYITTRVLDDVVNTTAAHGANVVRGIRIFYDEQSGTASFFGGVNIHYRYIST